MDAREAWTEFIHDMTEIELDAMLVEGGIDPASLVERGTRAISRGVGASVRLAPGCSTGQLLDDEGGRAGVGCDTDG